MLFTAFTNILDIRDCEGLVSASTTNDPFPEMASNVCALLRCTTISCGVTYLLSNWLDGRADEERGGMNDDI